MQTVGMKVQIHLYGYIAFYIVCMACICKLLAHIYVCKNYSNLLLLPWQHMQAKPVPLN